MYLTAEEQLRNLPGKLWIQCIMYKKHKSGLYKNHSNFYHGQWSNIGNYRVVILCTLIEYYVVPGRHIKLPASILIALDFRFTASPGDSDWLTPEAMIDQDHGQRLIHFCYTF